MATPTHGEKLPKKIIMAALLGNFVEWYDLAIYAYVAAAIGMTFFADAPPAVQLIAAFAAFALTYVARPLSGLVLGALGDRIGRKKVLVFTILTMGFATTAIGILPGYATWGVISTLLLLFLRILQGIGAGGEFMGAATFVAEHSPRERRGFAMGLIQLGTGLSYPAAFAIAFALIQIGGAEWFNAGGWRVLFLISAPLTLVALFIRKNLEETPVFVEMSKARTLASAPVREMLRSHWTIIVACFLFQVTFSIVATLFLFYLPGQILGRSEQLGSGAQITVAIGLVVFAFSIPAWGYMVDRITRHTARLSLTVSAVVLMVPCMIAIESSNVGGVLVGYVVMGLLAGFAYPVTYVNLVEAVPARVRFTGTALIDNLSKAILIGTTPLVALGLIELAGTRVAPGWYAALMSLLAVGATFWLRRMDRHGESDPMAAQPSDLEPPIAAPAPAP